MNMIILGGYLKVRPVVEVANVLKGLKKSLPERHHHLLSSNEKALHIGMDLIKKIN
jgi:2-oxoglutarate ferredoxin oxidoreductase subunit gamma